MKINSIEHNNVYDNTPYDNVKLWLYTTSELDYCETVVGVEVKMYSRIILDFKDKESAIKFIESLNINNMSETKFSDRAILRFYKGNKYQFDELVKMEE